jgi:rhodanese-related sulfurtransferase
MNTKVFEPRSLLPVVAALAVVLGMWGAALQVDTPEMPGPAIDAPRPAPRISVPEIPVPQIALLDAVAAIARGAVVIDVRTRDAYAEGHITGAISMPLEELQRRAPELAAATTTEYIVYCGNGSNLGPQAARALTAAGHPAARNLPAGYSGWKAAGQAVATGAK